MQYFEDTSSFPGTETGPDLNPGIESPGIEGQTETFNTPQGGDD